MKLEITKEKILEAASNYPQAKQTLEILFPEAFEKEVDLTFLKGSNGELIISQKTCEKAGFLSNWSDIPIQIRTGGQFARKGFWLSDDFEWKIEKDDLNSQVLTFKKNSNG